MTKIVLFSQVLLLTSLLSARDPECRTMHFNVGPSVNYAQYKFGCTPKVQGALVGVHADFSHSRECSEFALLRFDGRWSVGKFEECDLKDRIRDYRTELDLGWNFEWSWCDRDMTFTPFFGIGFFFENNKVREEESCTFFEDCCSTSCSIDACAASKLRYYNLFVPVGFNTLHRVNDCFSWGLTAEYRIDAWTRLKVSQDCCTLCDKVQPESRTHGVMVEVPLTWNLCEGECMDWHVKVVPFFDWNRFGDANCDCTCTSTCHNSCSSSSSCCSADLLDALNDCAIGFDCDIPKLSQWYLGARVDLGVRF